MADQRSSELDDPTLAWCAERLNLAPAAAFHHLDRLLNQVAGEVASALGTGCQETGRTRFVQRLRGCVVYHWQRLFQEESLELPAVLERMRAGTAGDLLRDVVLAQALEMNDSKAAEVFEREFMPAVRRNAHRLSGSRGEELVENFAATLVLSTEGQRPRIARYQGRTSLAGWLRVVTINYLTSEFRRRGPRPLIEEDVVAPISERVSMSDRKMCQELLSGLIQSALSGLSAEDRLVIRMLVLDGVPQGQLARSLGIHSGNLTRRRQRISDAIWQGVKQGACRRGQDKAASDCLELIVADGDRQLSQSLGEVLARELQAVETRTNPSAES